MSDSSQKPKLVKAVYHFQPSNTDELSFQKGDVITVAQAVDGGWWEGTLNGLTGWFPSNYVREMTLSETRSKSPIQKPTDIVKATSRESNSNQLNHSVVLQSLISTEKTFVGELEDLLQSCLRRLETGSILSSVEYVGICGNLEEISNLHRNLLTLLEETMQLPVHQQKIGGLFLQMAPQVQILYQKYCSNHPKAVLVLQSKKDELSKYMEGLGAPAPGVMTLTTSLSKPFRRLDRYSSLLKELERHTEEGHADRGDTQRAISVYREISISCTELRKQKELEYDVLHSDIRSCEGEEISQLGDVLMLSHVLMKLESGESKERLLLFFHGVLVLLSVPLGVGGYVYEGKVNINGLSVSSLDDSETLGFAFEITGGSGGLERLVVACTSLQEKNKWLYILKQHGHLIPSPSVVPKQQNLQMPVSHVTITTPLQPKLPQQSTIINSSTFSKSSPAVVKPSNMSCLRPYPPLRPSVLVKDDGTRSPRSGRRILGSNRRKPVDDAKTLEDDAVMLKVIEAYCTSTKSRQTVNSSIFEQPHVIIAEEEKMIIEETKGNQTIVEEKTLVDTVYSLRDQVKELRQEQQKFRKDLDREKQARKKLETMLTQSLKSIVESTFESTHDTLTTNAHT